MAVLSHIGNKESLEQRAYDEIRRAIITNGLKPRQTLPEEQIAKELGISRTPVRSALRRLEQEQLVQCNSSKTMEVAAISQKDMNDLALVRLSLEPLACGLLANTVAETQLKTLYQLMADQKEAAEKDALEDFITLEYEWNTAIARFTGNQWLHMIIMQIEVFVCRALALSENLNMHWEAAVNEHALVLDAIRNQKAQVAEDLMRQHILRVRQRID